MDYFEMVTQRLEAGINVMQHACDDAKRCTKGGDSAAIRAVISRLRNGFNLAMLEVESAIGWADDSRVAQIEAARSEGKS